MGDHRNHLTVVLDRLSFITIKLFFAVSTLANQSTDAEFVFDLKKLFLARSRHLNTEIGLIIDSPELAQ